MFSALTTCSNELGYVIDWVVPGFVKLRFTERRRTMHLKHLLNQYIPSKNILVLSVISVRQQTKDLASRSLESNSRCGIQIVDLSTRGGGRLRRAVLTRMAADDRNFFLLSSLSNFRKHTPHTRVPISR